MLRGSSLILENEAPFPVDLAAHDPAARRRQDTADGVDQVLYSPSSPLGIESLPAGECESLLDAWHALAGEPHMQTGGNGIWATANLHDPDLDGLGVVLKHPKVRGLQVPATHLHGPAALERATPLLAVAEAADVPVLVHPGPATNPPGSAGTGLPAWWPALVSYPAQLAQAWFAWHEAGRTLLPRLRVCFVALAGLAPLHHERLVQRGGKFGQVDPLLFYETSSYGHRAVDAMSRVVGVDALVHGSDRPYAVPTDLNLGAAFDRALLVANPQRFLEGGHR